MNRMRYMLKLRSAGRRSRPTLLIVPEKPAKETKT